MSVVNTPRGRQLHLQLIQQFLLWLNSQTSNFVLKGGTALMVCYNLGRFSEDIDLDVTNLRVDIVPFVKKFCDSNGLNFRVAKDTKTTKRCMVHYISDGNQDATLKIEVSYRSIVSQDEITRVNNINVYTISDLMTLKLHAFISRDKIRDIYDVLYIYKNYANYLPATTAHTLRKALAQKGIDYISEILDVQKDPLINSQALEDLYLNTCLELGVEV